MSVIIIGSGLGGYHVAKEFRKHDTTTPLTILTADGGEFYSKPMLSNALGRDMSPEEIATADAGRMAAQLDADIRAHATVSAIDTATRRIETGTDTDTDTSDSLAYSRLVLAVGAHQIPLPIEGDARDAILSINSLDDFARFRRAITDARRVAVIGPGLIGCEFANDIATTGREVVVIGPDPTPLGRLLPPQAGRRLSQALASAGVEWRLGTSARSITRDNDGFVLDLEEGSQVRADVVLSAIGLRPNIALAQQAGLSVERGIVVDRCLRASAEDVHAIGDCAQFQGLLLPYVMPIMFGARALGKTLAGDVTEVRYPVMPVVVKTPAHPVVVCPPPPGSDGQWEETVVGDGIRGLFRADDGQLLGFALTGEAIGEKQGLVKEVRPLTDPFN